MFHQFGHNPEPNVRLSESVDLVCEPWNRSEDENRSARNADFDDLDWNQHDDRWSIIHRHPVRSPRQCPTPTQLIALHFGNVDGSGWCSNSDLLGLENLSKVANSEPRSISRAPVRFGALPTKEAMLKFSMAGVHIRFGPSVLNDRSTRSTEKPITAYRNHNRDHRNVEKG